MTASVCVFLCLRCVFLLFYFVLFFLIRYRQHCVCGDDGRGLLLGWHGRQGGQTTVSAHLYVHEWLLRLPVIFRAGLWRLLALSHDVWLRVSMFPTSSAINDFKFVKSKMWLLIIFCTFLQYKEILIKI